MGSRPWTDRDRETANSLRDSGLSRAAIAERLGRTRKAVANYFDKDSPVCALYGGGEPIGACPEERRLARNAIAGSERLASAINFLGLRP